MRSIIHQFGPPTEVIRIEETDTLAPADGEIRVRMLAAPINPADINLIQGNYGIVPDLPCTPGIEGCGEVTESNSPDFTPGDRVIFTRRTGTWCRELVCPADAALKIPASTPVEQAAMLKVNPLTAWAMLTQFVKPGKNEYVIQNAANSGVGTCVIQIARLLGLRTINLVRREELFQPLSELGADIVLLDNAESIAHIKSVFPETPPRLGLNAVGGDSALRLMDALAPGGTHITYGAMGMRSLKVPNKFLIFKRIQLHGFWSTEWIREQPRQTIRDTYALLTRWLIGGTLAQPVAARYPLGQIQQALTHAMQDKRGGKILLTMP